MTTPSEPEDHPAEGVNLGKDPSGPEEPFDPYRFGKPDHPIPAEYAPPGYTGPTLPPPSPYAPPGGPSGGTGGPFNNPPGTPYGAAPQYPYQQQPPPYGQYPQSAPPPPTHHGYVQPRTGNGRATAGLVLGILAIVLCWLSFLDAIFVVLGLVFSLLGLGDSRRRGSGRGMAVAGIVCSLVGALLATVLSIMIIHAADKCGGLNNRDAPGWNQCVRDNF